MGEIRNVRNGLETQSRFSCGLACVSNLPILYEKYIELEVRKASKELFSLLIEIRKIRKVRNMRNLSEARTTRGLETPAMPRRVRKVRNGLEREGRGMESLYEKANRIALAEYGVEIWQIEDEDLWQYILEKAEKEGGEEG